jgi:hypothetical protein
VPVKKKTALDSQAPLVRQLCTAPDPSADGLEYLLYTDADVRRQELDDPGDGAPLFVYGTAARAEKRDAFGPKLALRVRHSWPLYPWNAEGRRPQTVELLQNAPWWTGLTVDQEVAALLSLATRTRIRSGGPVRRFPPAGGEGAAEYIHHHVPVLLEPRTDVMLPGFGGRRFDSARVLLSQTLALAALSPEPSGVLVKAAAAYADAVWIADSDPVQGWLRLVTAVETVADFIGLEDETLEEQFRSSYPQTAKVLEQSGVPELVKAVAETMKDKLGAGAKFRRFLKDRLPPPPAVRPPDPTRQVNWVWEADREDKKAGIGDIKDAATTVYNHRSGYLHAGKPFPPALSAPPWPVRTNDAEEIPEERPPHDTLHGGGAAAAWKGKDVPMYLHVFEYIVHSALMTWWKEQVEALAAVASEAGAERPEGSGPDGSATD